MNFEIFQSGKSFTVFLSFITSRRVVLGEATASVFFLFMNRDESLSSLSKQFPHQWFSKEKETEKVKFKTTHYVNI